MSENHRTTLLSPKEIADKVKSIGITKSQMPSNGEELFTGSNLLLVFKFLVINYPR